MEGLFMLALPWLLVNTIIAFVVSDHASKNGKSGYFWLVFFLGIIGVLLYVADMAAGQQDNPGQTKGNRHSEKNAEIDRRKTIAGNDGRKSIEEKAKEAAVSAVYDELKAVGQEEPDYFIEHVYPVHPAGYSTGKRWWEFCIVPGLRPFTDVEPPEGEGNVWSHKQSKSREKAAASSETREDSPSSNSWETIPETDFMHQEVGDRGRGLYVEVKDGEKEGGFFVKEDGVAPESYKLESEYGTTWVRNAKSYLRRVYLQGKTH